MSAHDPFRRVERVERVARTMDRAFRVPLTGIRIGWDSIIGVVPGIGDTLALAPALWILNEAREMGAPKPLLVQMAGNIGVDWVIGLVPLIGDILDVAYKSNLRNAALLRAWVEDRHRVPGDGTARPEAYGEAMAV